MLTHHNTSGGSDEGTIRSPAAVIEFLIGMAAGYSLLAHHYRKYGLLMHRTLPDHGVYGVVLIVVGSVGFLL
jgi:hypothetical protein